MSIIDMDSQKDTAPAGVCKEMKRGAEERSWWGRNYEPDHLSLSWHPHHSLLALSSAPGNLTAPLSANGHSRACHKCAAEGRSHGYVLKHGVLLPQEHPDTLLWSWDTKLHHQPCSAMATVNNAALPPAPACGPWSLLQMMGPRSLTHISPVSSTCSAPQLLVFTVVPFSDHIFLSNAPLQNAITPKSVFCAVCQSLAGYSSAFRVAICILTHKKWKLMMLHDKNAI